MKPVHISLSNVGKHYVTEGENLEVFSNLSLEIPPAKRLCIIGRSGSGKSTLLNILGTLDKPSNGAVLFNGKNILAQSPDQISNWRNTTVGFIFQFHRLLSDFSALENIMLPGIIRGDARPELKKRAERLLEYLELSNRGDHRPGKLSGGEQQRVAIARALICNPSVILADEPTGNLDYDTAASVSALLNTISIEKKCTVIVVTHNREMMKGMDACYELKNRVLSEVKL